jgi:putative methionine-R-sulfoxide reductase with GAF domain
MEQTLQYLAQSGLYRTPLPAAAVEQARQETARFLSDTAASLAQRPLGQFDQEALFVYQSPKFEGGACSLDFGTEPYDLAKALGGRTESGTRQLALMQAAVARTAEQTGVDWVGIYRKFAFPEGDVLVKLAYRGLESRAEFPLYLPEFPSNNKDVGLSGKAMILNDLHAYLQSGGAYYECDATVLSEACLPIYGPGGQGIVGIVDAEHRGKYFFGEENTAALSGLCIALSDWL